MKIVLAIHGTTVGETEERYIGSYPDHLTPKGKKESKELGESLSELEIQKIFASSQSQAKETALIISKITKLPITFIDTLKERNTFGPLTGLTKKEALKKHEDIVEELENDPVNHSIEGSENYFNFAERVIKSFNEIVETEIRNDTEAIAIISHVEVLRVILREILGFEVENINSCAMIELEYDGDGYEIISFNGIVGIEAAIV